MRGNVRIVRAVASMVLGLGLVKRVDKFPTQDWLEAQRPAISQVFGKTAAILNVFQRLSIFAFSHHFRFC